MGHLDYNKLVDTVFVVGRNLVLRMNVGLYETNANGERIFYHKEYRYKAKHETRYSLFRNFSYFLTLENIKSNEHDEKDSVMIRIQEQVYLKEAFEEAIKWFTHKKYSYIFTKNEYGDLKVNASGLKLILNRFPAEKFIGLEPSIYTKGTTEEPGIRIYLNSETNYCDTSYSQFIGLFETIKTFNIYLAAQNILNYFAAKPEVNVVDLDSYRNAIPDDPPRINRKLAPKKDKSIFGGIDDLL